MGKSVILLTSIFLITGCASYVPIGSLYTEGTTGLQDNGGPTSKTGRACVTSFFGLIATGDGSIEEAKRAGSITKVSTVDYETRNFLGIYGEHCTVVKGE